MSFYPEPLPLPGSVQTSTFILSPLTPAHGQRDYDAIMGNKQMLRLWSGSSWPNDNFTLADNLKDLRWHDDEHQQRIAFTFTMLNLKRDRCLGCVYINPLKMLLAENPDMATAVAPQDALVRFWSIESRHDPQLLETLNNWFSHSWAFERIYYHTRIANVQQSKCFSEQLAWARNVQISQRGGLHQLYYTA